MICAVSLGAQEFGYASYYADKYHGRSTASGDKYDKTKYTAAHKTLPFGTVVKVTRIDNQKSVIVTVNDRGPYAQDRIIDLSRIAAQDIGLIQDGIANVKVEVLDKNKEKEVAAAKSPTTKKTSTKKPKEPKRATEAKKSTSSTSSSSAKKLSKSSSAKLINQNTGNISGLYQVHIERPKSLGYSVQVAHYGDYNNAMNHVGELKDKWFNDVFVYSYTEKGKAKYKVFIGNFEDQAKADAYRKSLKSKYKLDGFVVDLNTIE